MKKIVMIISFLTLSINIHALDFETLIKKSYSSSSEKLNQVYIDKIKTLEIGLLSPRDVNFALTPSVESEYDMEFDVTGTVSLKIPTGLTELEREKLNSNRLLLEIGEKQKPEIIFESYKDKYNLYQDLWLLQSESIVLDQEIEASEFAYEMYLKNFEVGSISFIDLNKYLDLLEQRKVSYQENILEQKLTWYELMSITNLDYDLEDLTRLELDLVQLPTPPDLYIWIKENNTQIKSSIIDHNEINTTIDRLKSADISLDIAPYYTATGNQFTATLSYDIFGKELAPSVKVSNLINTTSADWNAGVTFSLNLGSNKGDINTIDALEMDLIKNDIEIEDLLDNLNLKLRSSYQQYHKNKELLLQAYRSYEIVKNSHYIIKTKTDIGQLSNYELYESNAQLARSLWKIEAARINTEKSWLDIIDNASYYNQIEITYKK